MSEDSPKKLQRAREREAENQRKTKALRDNLRRRKQVPKRPSLMDGPNE
ncbi:MAG: hypothetical protein V3U82_02695 [Robiginitomaculum sp.]